MRTKKMKQISMVLLSVALIGMVGDGCGSTQSKTQGQTDTEVQQDTQKMEEEKGGEREKLVIGIQTNTFVTDYDDNYLTNKLEKDLGMEIEFYLLPNNPEDVRDKDVSDGDEWRRYTRCDFDIWRCHPGDDTGIWQ